MAELENLHQVMQDYSSLRTGDLRIGTLPVTGSHSLINGISSFKKNYPGINIRLVEAAGSYDLIKMLQTGSIDIAYLIPPPDKNFGDQIIFHPLLKGNMVLVTAKTHRFAGKKKVSLAEMAKELFIFPPNTHSMYHVAMDACHQSGFEPKIACECGQLNMVFNLVAKGAGISFASSQLIEEALPSNIKLIPLDPLIERTICLVTLKDKHQLPIISVFRDSMLKAAPLCEKI